MPIRSLSLCLFLFIFRILMPDDAFSQLTGNYGKTAIPDLLPVPQKQSFTGRRFTIDKWTISGLPESEPAVKSLVKGLFDNSGLRLLSANGSDKKHSISLVIKQGSVIIPARLGKKAFTDQAYRLNLNSDGIIVSANSSEGLYYGVQTLLQLLRKENGQVFLPEGEITDWPDLEVRMIYWDCAHHLDRLESLKYAIRLASFYKINAFALKLEGHFMFKSAGPVVEPYAFTPAEYQELTDYALDHFVQLVPYLDAPAHVSFILKHPEYKELRAIPNSNYELCITNQGTYDLMSGMFNDLMEANLGGKYILLSTDEAYYAGKAESEKAAAADAGSNGRLLASFITRMADELHGHGRTVISWCEYPLTEKDIDALPSHLVNGVYNKEWTPAFRKKGIRQFIYTSTQGEEPLFPGYYQEGKKGRVEEIIGTIHENVAGGISDIPGVIIAAWGDSGLHPATFWLGYSTGAAAAWNLNVTDAAGLTRRFLNTFYGDSSQDMEQIYRMLCSQAQFWGSSWETVSSTLRTPLAGNSQGIYDEPRPAKDQTLPLPPVPSPIDLSIKDVPKPFIIKGLDRFIRENDELTNLLRMNMNKPGSVKHNLEVLLSITDLCRQNLDMLSDLMCIDSLVRHSSEIASNDPDSAITLLHKASVRAKDILAERAATFRIVEALWYQDWYPVVEEANGRKFLFSVDDVKDHLPGRTTDLSYLIYRQIHYPLEKWIENVTDAGNKFSAKVREKRCEL